MLTLTLLGCSTQCVYNKPSEQLLVKVKSLPELKGTNDYVSEYDLILYTADIIKKYNAVKLQCNTLIETIEQEYK